MSLVITKTLKMIGLFLLFICLSGCPYYPHTIHFSENNKTKEPIFINFKTNDFHISIRGDSYFNSDNSFRPGSEQYVDYEIVYDLDLNIYKSYDSQKINLNFHPESIQIFFQDFELKPVNEPVYKNINLSIWRYETKFMFTDLDTLKCVNDGYNIKIILNNWLLNDGVSVFIDTLYACDKKINQLRLKEKESGEIIYIE